MRKLLAIFTLALSLTACEFTADHLPAANAHTQAAHASPHARMIAVHGSYRPGTVLIGCGNYHAGRWSEGFYYAAWRYVARVGPHTACGNVKLTPKPKHFRAVHGTQAEDTVYVRCSDNGLWPTAWDDLSDTYTPRDVCADRTH